VNGSTLEEKMIFWNLKRPARSWVLIAVAGLMAVMILGGGIQDAVASEEGSPICVAIRGNGELIFAHFPALARLAEHYGPFEGVAGGSSGSISSFLTESMHMNPLLNDCGDQNCSRAEAGARLSLMYKSVDGYLFQAESQLLHDTMSALQDIVEALGDDVDALIAQGKYEDAWSLLLPELQAMGSLVNPEFLDLVANSQNPEKHIPEMWDGIKHIMSFSASDPLILLRPGIINFHELAADFGEVGNFFAGYGAFDASAWQVYFDECAMAGRGKSPGEVQAMMMSGGQSCGDYLLDMVATWRSASLPLPNTPGENRVYDRIGENFRALAITSVMTGDAAGQFETAKDAYFSVATDWVPDVSFQDIKAGYWGQSADTQSVVANALAFEDLKSAKAWALGDSQWKDILSVSLAEPGLSRALEISDSEISAGGWADLAPVLALKNAGCEHVVYLTRQGHESNFAMGVTELLGSSEADRDALFDLGDPNSGFALSLTEAAAVYCTNWDAHPVFSDPEGLVDDAWNAPFEIHDPSLVPVWGPVHGATANAGLPGCTPGVIEGGGSSCTPIWVAAAAAGEGFNGTQWRTDLAITNRGLVGIEYSIQLLPRGEDNGNAAMGETFNLGANQSVTYADAWTVFGGSGNTGAINVCVNNAPMVGVSSRTYNVGGGGTFGQSVIGVAGDDDHLIGSGHRERIGFLSQDEDFRTNIGFMNAADAEVTIEVEFFSADGTSLGVDSITLAPLSNNQWNKAFERVTQTQVSGGYVDVWSDTAGASFLVYASVVDRHTGDPMTLWPF
jgi:hypothetical protein